MEYIIESGSLWRFKSNFNHLFLVIPDSINRSYDNALPINMQFCEHRFPSDHGTFLTSSKYIPLKSVDMYRRNNVFVGTQKYLDALEYHFLSLAFFIALVMLSSIHAPRFPLKCNDDLKMNMKHYYRNTYRTASI